CPAVPAPSALLSAYSRVVLPTLSGPRTSMTRPSPSGSASPAGPGPSDHAFRRSRRRPTVGAIPPRPSRLAAAARHPAEQERTGRVFPACCLIHGPGEVVRTVAAFARTRETTTRVLANAATGRIGHDQPDCASGSGWPVGVVGRLRLLPQSFDREPACQQG